MKEKDLFFDFNKINDTLSIHGIRIDTLREIEGRGAVSIDMDKLFKKKSKEIESIKNINEMKTIIKEGINAICGSCFSYIDYDDTHKLINILCNTEYDKRVLNNGEEYFGLSVIGKEYSEIK